MLFGSTLQLCYLPGVQKPVSDFKQVKMNTIWLAIFQLAKMVFPFLILPILTRRLLITTYGDITFIKTIMNFLQIFIDFGFMLSATKEIAKIKNNPAQIQQILADTLLARILLGGMGLIVILIASIFLPILSQHFIFSLLSYLTIFLSIFLFDFLFRGLEIIHIMTIRFVVMKTISFILTVFFVRNDENIMLIPLFDILSSLIAIILVFIELQKSNLHIIKPRLKSSLQSLKSSFVYFLSDISATALNALSTIIIGLVFSSTEIALFGVSIQIIGAIQALLGQLASGIYPNMVRQKSQKFIQHIFKITLPFVLLFTLLVIFCLPLCLQILAGTKYTAASLIIQILAPTIIFSFCNTLLGWPTLGVINHQKQVTASTIISTVFNLAILVLLLIFNHLTLYSVAITRVVTEVVLFCIRFYYFRKFRHEFNP